ncbi:zinc-dependent metalloprotease [Flavobacterium sediminis]|nr:zinc-dependent metalloprotease family protein [Flavobacterium sediminis]
MPNSKGELEHFRMYEASNFDSDLQAQFPDIRSYVGEGIEDKYAQVRLSIDPRGIQSMVFRADKRNDFLEPYSTDGKVYVVYNSSRNKGKLPFTCSTPEQSLATDLSERLNEVGRSSTGQLLDFRLALSCTAEYANYFGATSSLNVSLVMAAFNATMTRVNGVFEKDFAIHMTMIANTSSVIYYNPTTDPYSDASSMGNWNSELQTTLTSVIGEANYDVGHLFGASGGGGNAGCIGCVCVNGQKGSGITSPADGIPEGDNFDIDYVAHELGHQFGANHTFSFSNEGTGVNMEVGSGSTIMGYAGITSQDIQSHSDDFFHSASIAQVQANMATKSCPTSTPITHGSPVVDAGANYTIPKSTPFILDGSATDAGGGSLTYCWEQYDNASPAQTGANSAASETKASGPNWMSYKPVSTSVRYMPNLTSVFNGSTTTSGSEILIEALSSVSRNLNFRLTVRDNVTGQGQTGFDDMVVTVDGSKGPLTVTSQNATGISYDVNSVQTVTWTVNNTNTITGGSNVDILITSDGGATWTTLLANTPNDGSEAVTMPATASPFCRLMVKASNNIFFNVNTEDFAVGYVVTTTCNTYTNSTPLVIPDGTAANTPGAVVSNTISVPATGTISDVNVSLDVTHTWPNDLVIEIDHPDGSTYDIVWDRACGGNDNFNVTLSDGSPTFTCVANMTGTFSPSNPLSVFNGLDPNGTWTLYTADFYNADTGQINSWSIEVCTQTAVLATKTFDSNDFVIYPNPNNGSFNLQLTAVSDNITVRVNDIRGRLILDKQIQANGLVNESIQLSNAQSGVYLVTIEDGGRKVTKKIVIE